MTTEVLGAPNDGLTTKLVRLWDRSMHVAARLGYAMPLANPERYRVQLHRNVVYREPGGRAHRLDVYRPWTRERTPTLMYVHGGGFALLSKDTHRVMALSFAARGYTVFNINYRVGPRHLYPAALEDSATALEWVLEHAAEYGADPKRIVLAGESAGANLVTALAYCVTHPRPEPFAKRLFERNIALSAVLPIYGLLDLHDMERFNHPRLSRLLKMAIHRAGRAYVGSPLRRNVARAPLASPLRLLEEPAPAGARPLPPFFVACGTADPLFVDSKRLERALAARGASCEFSIHPGEIHGFNAMVWRQEARAKWDAAFRFLQRHVPPPGASQAPGPLEGRDSLPHGAHARA